MKQKSFIPILILILIALTAIGYFGYKNYWPKIQVSPTPITSQVPNDNPANWKTYTNLDWNYEIKVPNEWKQITQSARFNNHLGFNASDVSFLDISVNKFNVNSLKQYLEIIDKEDKDQVKILETKIITPNIMIERKEEMLEAGMKQLVFYTVRNNYVVRLSLIPADGNISKIESSEVYKYYNQILSTFKFLDQLSAEGKFCGGIAANLPENQCPDGFYCKLDGNYPDASGVCIKE